MLWKILFIEDLQYISQINVTLFSLANDHSQQLQLAMDHSQSDTLYPGDTAQVCEIESNEFICSTADPSINATCNRDRCPLQGPPMAAITEAQLLTGSAKKDVLFCVSRRQSKKKIKV